MKASRKSAAKTSHKASDTPSDKPAALGYLDGQMLIAMPTMGDERFTRSVIYVCAHSTEGAMGIIVNQPAANIKSVSYTHLRAHETDSYLVCRLLLEKKKIE